jgi:hypothetical protein
LTDEVAGGSEVVTEGLGAGQPPQQPLIDTNNHTGCNLKSK